MLKKIIANLKWLIPFDIFSKEENVFSAPIQNREEIIVAGVSYIPLASAAILLLRKDNTDFIQQHAKQSLILMIFALLVFMLLSSVLRFLLELIIIFYIIFSAYKALSGRKVYIPLITEISRFIEL